MRPAPPPGTTRTLRIVHLFPDLLSTYGDGGNIRALVVRASRRGIRVEVERVLADHERLPFGDLFVVGGGEDRNQLRVEAALARLGPSLEQQLERGAALLAICGGYQNLGRRYQFSNGRTVHGPGIFPIETVGAPDRLVGPVVATLVPQLLSRTPLPAARTTVVGFENHAGRSRLEESAVPFANVERGAGNNGEDGTDGAVFLPASEGLRGLRIGTYLHGPLLPRNPHVADSLIAAGLANRHQDPHLERLDNGEEWRAHDHFAEQARSHSWIDRLPSGLRQVVEPVRNAIGG